MNARGYWILTIFIVSIFSASCAINFERRKELSSIFPLKKVNLELIIEQQRGLEIDWEDAKDVRDFYRGGVQHKAKAEEKFRTNVYSEAWKFYQSSNEFFAMVLNYLDQDAAEYFLFEGHQILFFPNLLTADNYLKMGKILKSKSRHWSARRQWRQALSYIKRSLKSEPTEWGLLLEQEITALLKSE